jgi:hypothetical protein
MEERSNAMSAKYRNYTAVTFISSLPVEYHHINIRDASQNQDGLLLRWRTLVRLLMAWAIGTNYFAGINKIASPLSKTASLKTRELFKVPRSTQ